MVLIQHCLVSKAGAWSWVWAEPAQTTFLAAARKNRSKPRSFPASQSPNWRALGAFGRPKPNAFRSCCMVLLRGPGEPLHWSCSSSSEAFRRSSTSGPQSRGVWVVETVGGGLGWFGPFGLVVSWVCGARMRMEVCVCSVKLRPDMFGQMFVQAKRKDTSNKNTIPKKQSRSSQGALRASWK